ncbi:hypothetical protein HYV49_01020 [Candidatus Pacearchaeota archaeon]|nr:hypothetical protein [Candidatus Pacearchaeota archaeon]
MPYDIIVGRDEDDKKRFADKGLVYLGKGYVKMRNYTSLSNRILMDIARSHVILVAGKRGSGKCLTGDTLITLADGSLVPIENLENDNNSIFSLDNELKIKQKEKKEFFKRKVNRVIKLALRSGREIKLTPEHPLFTLKGWKPVQELTLGSRVATPRNISVFGTNEMPEHEIKLLSYLIAEGHTKKIVLFSNSDKEIVDEFRESLNRLDPNLKLIEESKYHYRISYPLWKNRVVDKSQMKFNKQKRRFDKGSKIILEKRSIRNFIEKYDLFGKLAINKTIPKEIMKLTKPFLSLFLNRLFSCDGSIYKHKSGSSEIWEVSYSSSSEKLIRQVQNLLLRFGILSRLRKKKVKLKDKIFDSFELVINSYNSVKFITEIGFFGAKRQKQDQAMKEIVSIRINPNVDTIPKEVWEFFKPRNWAHIGRALGYKYPKAMRERIKYAPSRSTLLQIAEVEQHNGLQLLATSDIFWDEISSMEILEGSFNVYDFSVPESHNFIANDIIVHNSYSLSAIAEELSMLKGEEKDSIASLIFDTMGIFWTMKYKNDKEKELLAEWGLKPDKVPVRVFAPFGKFKEYEEKGIPVDEPFAINPSDVGLEDWLITFNLSLVDPVSVLIQNVFSGLKKNYDIDDITKAISAEHGASAETKNAAISLFRAADSWGIFSKKGSEIKELVKPGMTTIVDISVYNAVGVFNIRALVIGLLSRKLFRERMEERKREELQSIRRGAAYLAFKQQREVPIIWVFIDEVHEFLGEEENAAKASLIQLLREGRQPGISIVMATQQPGALIRDVITQTDILISHKVTALRDIGALNEMG